ncbi:MAG: hypothetical protein WBA45_08770 [Microthrixaceae bacterium]
MNNTSETAVEGVDAPVKNRSIAALLVAAAAPLVLLTPMLMQRRISPQDEGQLLAYPSLMIRGFQANTDFVYTYGIANLWTLKAAFMAFGESVTVERGVGLAFRLILVLVVTDMVRRTSGRFAGGRFAALAAGWTCALILAFEGIQAFAWISALTVGLAAVWMAANLAEERHKLASGLPWLLAGAAISFRVDMALAAVGAVALTQYCRSFKPAPAWAAGGLVAGLAPMWIHLLSADKVLSDTLVDPILNGGGRRLPLVPRDRVLAFSIVLLAVSVVLVLAALWVGRSERPGTHYVNLLALSSLAILTSPQLIQRVDPTHFRYVGAVLVPAAIASAVLLYTNIPSEKLRRPIAVIVQGALGLALVAAVLLGFLPQLRYTALLTRATVTGASHELSVEVSSDGRVVPFDPAQSKQLQQTLNAASAAYEAGHCDRLFVGPGDLRYARYSDTFIYFLLDRFAPASRYLEFNPGGANSVDSKLASEVESADVVIVNSDWDDPASLDQPPGATASEAGPSSPNDVLRRSFVEVDSFGPWRLLLSERCRNSR